MAPESVGRRLRTTGLLLHIGPFTARIQTEFADVQEQLRLLYAHHQVGVEDDGAHFSVRVGSPSWARSLFRRQAQLTAEGLEPFIPLPRRMAPLMLEGGLNWCVGNYAHQFVTVHAGTVERQGRALVMPASAGSGKSTLCAALVHRGWRLLSDEFAILDPASGLLWPCPRPVALKDGAIGVIQEWAPQATVSAPLDNHEGQRVAYVRPRREAVERGTETAIPAWIVIPQYKAGAPTTLEQLGRARALMHLADNSFNFNHHAHAGYDCLAKVAERAPATVLRYSALEDGVRVVDELTRT